MRSAKRATRARAEPCVACAPRAPYRLASRAKPKGVPVMRVHHGAAGISVLVATFIAAAAMAQDAGMGLSEAQKRRALEIEATDRSPDMMAKGIRGQGLPGLASTLAGQMGKSVRPLVVPIESADTAPEGTRAARDRASQRAVVMRYDYATGITTRTTVDLETGKAVHVREDANYPTPLAHEEYDQALAVARRSVPEFDAIMKVATPETLRINTLTPLYEDPSNPRYGHRLVIVWIEAPTTSRRITVDLSTDEVVLDHH